MVLLHELAHVRRWDNLVNLLQRLIESLLFFHPAIWLVSRQIRRDREQCCDAVVVAHTAAPQAYAKLLTNIATSPPPLAGLALARHPLTARIRRILKLEDEPMLVSRSTIGAFAIAVVTLVVVILWQPAKTSIAEEPNAAVSNAKEKETVDLEETSSEEPSRHFEADASQEEIDEFVSELKATGFTLFIEKYPAGAITIRGTKEGGIAIQETKRNPDSIKEHPIPIFLSLEQQRMADLAYRALGIELEPLKPEEDAQITAKVFKGGLRATSYDQAVGIGIGDILIGLHAWPTQSLEDVAKILQRDDIAELSPLKYYILRPGNADGSWSSNPSENLITGRVAVNLEAIGGKTNAQLPTPHVSVFGEDPFGTRKDGSKNLTLHYDGKTFELWRATWRRDLSIELRIKAVHAFVAFAGTEYGKNAIDEIMAIVAQYDWEVLGINTLTDFLKQACIAAFTEKQLPIDIAVETIIAAKESKNARVQAFLPYVVHSYAFANEESNQLIREKFPELKLPEFGKGKGFGGGGGGRNREIPIQ